MAKSKLGISRATRKKLSYYGFGSFTALTALSPFLPHPYAYLGVSAALICGSAGLVGVFAPTRRAPPTLVFVSYGGTCRDPMAKVITESLLQDREPAVRILATALRDIGHHGASRAARHVVKEEMGADLLCDHRPTVLDESIVSDAGLILTMNEDHAKEIRKNFPAASAKIHSLLGFLGRTGDIEDPWRAPDAMDAETIKRYRHCFNELQKVLSENIGTLYAAVTA